MSLDKMNINMSKYIDEKNSPTFNSDKRSEVIRTKEEKELLKEFGIYRDLPEINLDKNIDLSNDSEEELRIKNLRKLSQETKFKIATKYFPQWVVDLYKRADFYDYLPIMRIFNSQLEQSVKRDEDYKDELEWRRVLLYNYVNNDFPAPRVFIPEGYHKSVFFRNKKAIDWIFEKISEHIDDDVDELTPLQESFLMQDFTIDCPNWGTLYAMNNMLYYESPNYKRQGEKKKFKVSPGWVNKLIKYEIEVEIEVEKTFFTESRGGIICLRSYLLSLAQLPNFNLKLGRYF
jgi:hypothetical protein